MSDITATITAVGGWVPEDKLTNADLEKMVDTNDEWITTRTGIKERRILKDPSKGTSYMAVKAVQDLCEAYDVDPATIDAVICATGTPDVGFVSVANIVAARAGIGTVFSFDIQAACSGFLYGLENGAALVKSGIYKKVLVIGADKMSSVVNYKDRTTCILFGDGAACALIEPSDDPYFGLLHSRLFSDGTYKELLNVKGRGSESPMTLDQVQQQEYYFYQDGKHVFKHAVTKMGQAARQVMEESGLEADDIDYLVPHQANQRIIHATAKQVGLPIEKVVINIEKYGNTTAATVPLCLWEWQDKFQRGENILMAAFGGGFTWGAMHLRWSI
jgi:3-oxoacyl-[acyl-carrier-protein] synthase-3